MTFMIGIFQFQCKSEHTQIKRDKIKQDMCKSESFFPYLQSITVFQ